MKVSGGRRMEANVFCTVEKAPLEKHQVSEAVEESAATITLVGCGSASLGTEVLIVDAERLTLAAPDEVGGVRVSGPGVARGYWNLPDITGDTFHAYLADTGQGMFLRTGDLGFKRGDELFITGRLKDLIIIRGFNHYPQDIELTTERCHPTLRLGGGAAFSVEVGGEERLVVVQEIYDRKKVELDKVIECISQSVIENHEIQVYAVVVVKPGQVPRTSSGKVQRHACRTKFLEGRLDVLAEWRAPLVEERATSDSALSAP